MMLHTLASGFANWLAPYGWEAPDGWHVGPEPLTVSFNEFSVAGFDVTLNLLPEVREVCVQHHVKQEKS